MDRSKRARKQKKHTSYSVVHEIHNVPAHQQVEYSRFLFQFTGLESGQTMGPLGESQIKEDVCPG
jgi:hypothetical protein